MCLALTGRVLSVDGDRAAVAIGDRVVGASVVLEPATRSGDWVSVAAGWILRRLTADQALSLMALEREGVPEPEPAPGPPARTPPIGERP